MTCHFISKAVLKHYYIVIITHVERVARYSRVVSVLDSGAEGLGSNRSCDAVG